MLRGYPAASPAGSRQLLRLIDVKHFTKGTNGKTNECPRQSLSACLPLDSGARPRFFESLQDHVSHGTPLAIKTFCSVGILTPGKSRENLGREARNPWGR